MIESHSIGKIQSGAFNKMREAPFWRFSNHKRRRSPWSVELDLDWDAQERLCVGREIREWPLNASAKANRLRRPEDAPWCSQVPIVSDCLRNAILEIAPDDVQFLPVTVYYCDKAVTEKGPYWVLIVTTLIDCADTARSVLSSEPDRYGQPWYWAVRLDPKAVQGEVNMFRVVHASEIIFASDVVRRHLQSRAFSGLTFFQADAPVPFW